MLTWPLAADTMEGVYLPRGGGGWQHYHVPLSENTAKTPKSQRRISAGERAVCAGKQWSHESFDLWMKLSSSRVHQGNQIIKLAPFWPLFWIILCPFGKSFHTVKVSLACC